MLRLKRGHANYEMDMCTGPLVPKIIRYSLPLMLTGILQLLYNAADIIVVGRFVGDTALAAVFQKMKTATVTVPEYDAFYLAAARTGYRLTADGRKVLEEEFDRLRRQVADGECVLKGGRMP